METLQLLFNVALSFVVLLVGWWNKLVWDSLKELKTEKEIHLKEYNEFRIYIATEYLKKGDLEKLFTEIKSRLDKLDTLDVSFTTNYVTRETFEKNFENLVKKLELIDTKISKGVSNG
jgi:hypothetical protein